MIAERLNCGSHTRSLYHRRNALDFMFKRMRTFDVQGLPYDPGLPYDITLDRAVWAVLFNDSKVNYSPETCSLDRVCRTPENSTQAMYNGFIVIGH
jgi:hypothetical protein